MSAALDLLASFRLEDGRRWGDAALPFQWDDARAVLDREGPPYHFISRGRGGSKTGDLAAIVLAAMLTQAPPGARLFAAASDRDQAALLMQSVAGFVERSPALLSAVDCSTYRATAARGVVLDVLAADSSSSWGLRPWMLVCDEIAAWAATPGPRTFWESLSSAVAKFSDARMCLISSAGDPAHFSRKIVDHAIGSPLWRVSELSGIVPWLDPARVEEQRQRLPESSYRRLFLNEWTASEDRLADPDDLAACVTLDGPLEPEPGRRYAIGLDIGLKNDRTVAMVAHAVSERLASGEQVVPRVVLDRLQVWQGTRANPVSLDDVERWVEQACRSYNRAQLVVDPWQAAGLCQRLQARGLRVLEFPFTQQSVSRLATNLLTLIRARRLSLPDDPELLDELLNVRLRETGPNMLRLDHDAGRHDDRAIALGLAALHLVEKRGGGGVRVHVRHPEKLEPMPGAVALIGEKDVEDRLNDDKRLGVIDGMRHAEERVRARREREGSR